MLLQIRGSRQIDGSGMPFHATRQYLACVSIILLEQHISFKSLTYRFEIANNSVAVTVPPKLGLSLMQLLDVGRFQLGFNFSDQVRVDISHCGDTSAGEILVDCAPAASHI